MALPKRRHSRSRSAKRRTHWKLKLPAVLSCPNCHKPKRPHRVCAHCGAYEGRDVIPPSES